MLQVLVSFFHSTPFGQVSVGVSRGGPPPSLLDGVCGKTKHFLIRELRKFVCSGVPERLSRLSIQLSISAQVMISRSVRSSLMSVSVLTVQNLLGILSRPLSLPLPCLYLHTRPVSKETSKTFKSKKEICQPLFKKQQFSGALLLTLPVDH